MKIIKSISEMQNWSHQYRCENPGKKIGFVPTMGYLHEGHLSLIREVAKKCDVTVVSIFVNPIQFNNSDDLKNYPRNLERDILLLNDLKGEAKVDILFNPDANEVYKNGFPDIFMDYPKLTNKLCGKTRPGHFSGVLTIVHNLFIWVKPHIAIFGLKDYQQYLVIKKMNADLHLGIEVIPGQLIRENDGLAMSSRNVRLSSEERKQALVISQALFIIKNEFQSQSQIPGKTKIQYLKSMLTAKLSEKINEKQIDYASLYNPDTLEELNDIDDPSGALIAVAAYVGKVRLIDNMLL